MSAPVLTGTLASPRLISEEDWKQHRLDSLLLMPEMPLDANGIPDILIDYQKRLLETTAVNQVTIYEKSRRTGVTWAAGADAVLTSAASRAAGGMDTLYIGYNLDMAREFIDTCAMWARVFNEAAVEGGVQEFMFDGSDGKGDQFIQAFRIRFASGFEIVALTSKPRSLRGRQGYVIIDEAAFHDQLDELLKAAFALLIWGGKVLVISTHDGEDNAFNKLIGEVRSGAKPYALLRTDFDDALRQGLYQRIALMTGKTWTVEAEAAWRSSIVAFYGEGADEELFCIPSKGGGAFLSAPLIEARMDIAIPVIRIERPEAFARWPKHLREADIAAWLREEVDPCIAKLDPLLRHFAGADIARVGDLTVFWFGAIARTLNRSTAFVIEIRNLPFDQQEQIFYHVFDRLPRRGGAKIDATGLGMSFAEHAQQKYGYELVEAIMFSRAWYLTEMPPMKRAFEDGAITIPKDDDILSDFRLIVNINGVAQLAPMRSGAKKNRHGDAAIACALWYSACRMLVEHYGYDSAHPGHGPDEGDEFDDDDGPLDRSFGERRDRLG